MIFVLDRPGAAEAVLQTALSFIDQFSDWVTLKKKWTTIAFILAAYMPESIVALTQWFQCHGFL